MQEVLQTVQEYAALLTAIGVLVAAWQLWWRRSLAQSAFEDSLSKEYRELIRDIPVDVLLGREWERCSADSDYTRVRESIFNYLDLCNEQTYLRKKRRVRRATWTEWASGIQFNLSLPMFAEVWNEVKREASDTFTELRSLEANGFKRDPVKFEIEK